MKRALAFFALVFFVVILLGIFAAGAAAHEDVSTGENLVKNKVSCDQLTNEQLEEIGEYYMEQMHPGEAHERMDEMMGGEGSASLKQVHVNLAKSFYCGEQAAMPMGMMNTIMGGSSTGMMGTQARVAQAMGGLGMMGGTVSLSGVSLSGALLNFLYIVVVAFAVSVVFWLTYKWIIKEKKK